VILVIMTETTADILAIGEIVDTKVDARRVGDGLRADMLSTTVSPLLGSFPCSAFAQNVGLVALTKIKSRYVVAMGGVILFLLGLLPVVGRVVAAIPFPVLGGAGIVLFGSVTASGIKTLSRVDFGDNLNLVIVATGIGIIPIASPKFWDSFPTQFGTVMQSGISAAAVVAVLLNLLFNEIKAGNRKGAPRCSLPCPTNAAPCRGARYRHSPARGRSQSRVGGLNRWWTTRNSRGHGQEGGGSHRSAPLLSLTSRAWFHYYLP